MLIPQEQPYLQGLNSYYLYIDKFVEHLQGEIGPGCLYFRSSTQEILVYFDEREILRGVVQDNDSHARLSPTLEPVLEALNQKNFRVTVYQLDPNAIFFWGQMPQFKRAKTDLNSTDINLPDLVFRLKKKKFSGFVHVKMTERKEGALIFFHEGERVGGSYSMGNGGLDTSNETYNRLLKLLQDTPATFAIGHFLAEKKETDTEEQVKVDDDQLSVDEMFFSNLDTALKEFLDQFVEVAYKKTKSDPVVLLKQKFMDRIDDYPFLDPFKAMFDYNNGDISFSQDAPREKIAEAVVNCVWDVIQQNKLEKKFRAAMNKWDYKSALEERDIVVVR